MTDSEALRDYLEAFAGIPHVVVTFEPTEGECDMSHCPAFVVGFPTADAARVHAAGLPFSARAHVLRLDQRHDAL